MTKKLTFIFAALVGLTFASCNNDKDDAVQLTFDEYGEYFASLYNHEGWLEIPCIIEVESDFDEYNEPYEDMLYIEYYPMGSSYDGDEILEFSMICIDYGGTCVHITGGLTGEFNHIIFACNKDNIDYWDETEDDSLVGYFKDRDDFCIKQVTTYPDGKYIAVCKPL